MARKLVLGPINIATGQSLAANFSSASTVVSFEDSISYQINVTTSDSIGTFYLQCSNDGVNFADVGTAGTVAAANDTIIVDIADMAEKYIRLRYASSTAGTGTCDIMLMARSVGA